MNYKEANIEALTDLVEKIDIVQIEIQSLLSLMDFGENIKNSGKKAEAEIRIIEIIDRFSEVYKSNRDKFVLKMITQLESLK